MKTAKSAASSTKYHVKFEGVSKMGVKPGFTVVSDAAGQIYFPVGNGGHNSGVRLGACASHLAEFPPDLPQISAMISGEYDTNRSCTVQPIEPVDFCARQLAELSPDFRQIHLALRKTCLG